MKKILFQGDSITDAGRNRESNSELGRGYPLLVGAKLGFEHPNEYEFCNKGISGNRIVDVYSRIKSDIINLKPDYMSILIGVNDVWHEIAANNGIDTKKFEKIYSMLIEEVLEALPNIKIMIIAPYVLKGSATVPTEDMPDRYDIFLSGVSEKAAAAKRIAEKYSLLYVTLQDKFEKASLVSGSDTYWCPDGVHPSYAGHALIASVWEENFKKLLK